ncbi:efflux RND transporter periplasmic adaptor subunit [Roseomonas marmotae]|uniref:Efflux RND transporter periplasmic adaptor subunit n=1 Tax=Roseomonas marmotae TaxID=2768161 RepID=A0ABS3KAA0_9PROT|nr:efflux RND transporter periplasmic adaptor subunit [Roseomonas marmotae]MBO1073952.1 efflux RND transporter periplasmic adaptor subunit [Roseomonas marmotae]QTI78746.1 efflux RND transporter periplasmic adaptor subunit [Roseomonas marmotae]
MTFPTRRGTAHDVVRLGRLALLALPLLLPLAPSYAQQPGGPPPAVGVAPVTSRPITEANEFIGQIDAVDRVDLQSRVTAFLQERLFEEGSEVKKGDLLFRLERPPFEASLQVAKAAVAQSQAQLQNANLTLGRAEALLRTPAGQRSTVDAAVAAARTAQAQLLSAQAQERQAQIELNYTEIRAPIDGRIGLASVTPGNVVTPSSGALATIVSQDPMYVSFTVPTRTLLELRERYAQRGGLNAVALKLRLPDGRIYSHSGTVDFVNIDVSRDTDSIAMRGSIPNPRLPQQQGGGRELVVNQLVSAILEALQPVPMLTVPRDAVLTDQQGDFVYVIGEGNRAERRSIRVGPQSNAELAVVTEGLRQGEQVVVEGLQRVRPGTPVSPTPVGGGGAPAGAGQQQGGASPQRGG